MLHVVDLDGAVGGRPANREALQRILQAVRIPLQVGGGVRDIETVRDTLELGARRVVIGTEAVQNPGFLKEACRDYPGRIVVGLDARDGRVAIRGWTQTTGVLAVELAPRLKHYGVSAIVFTDIHRDGMQTGPNIDHTRALAEAVSLPVIASGGVGSIDHIRSLLPLAASGVAGIITGKALYSGSLSFEDAAAAVRQSGIRCVRRFDI
jgi:phosphoribosylformimino-5-aminoimidazole carboxamide ribotide isomerase